MDVIYLAIALFMFVIGLCAGAITALIIRFANKKSAAKPNYSYTEKDRKQFQINQETLLNGRTDYSSKTFK